MISYAMLYYTTVYNYMILHYIILYCIEGISKGICRNMLQHIARCGNTWQHIITYYKYCKYCNMYYISLYFTIQVLLNIDKMCNNVSSLVEESAQERIIYVSLYICIHICVCVYIYIYIYTYTYKCINVYIYIHTYTRVCVYIYIYIYIYT